MRATHTPLAAFLALITLASMPSTSALAQPARRDPTPNDTLKSTEVADDHRVTFRIYAPKASDVFVSGDFGTRGKMTRSDDGVWSFTSEPLAPDFYSYIFTVDGVRTLDPKSALVKPGLSSMDSLLVVPDDAMDFEATKDVPHGDVRAVWYRSGTLDTQRRMHVYTPPGYEGGTAKYPVLYLLHGRGDEDSGWSTIGRAGFILDNLIASGKAVPMLIVMPNGSLSRPTSTPPRTPGAQLSPELVAARERATRRFVDELMKEIVPQVERTYRVKPGAPNRAIAGLSMGGGQTLSTILAHPDQFAYIGMWSAAIFGSGAEWEARNEAFLSKANEFNERVKRLEICVGDRDSLLAGSKNLAEVLQKRGIRHELYISGGGHTWINWRHYLNAFASKLFQ
jgi:enterochelin esterase family protein